jgi:hypothetical protein
MRTRNVMRDPYSLEEGIEFLIFSSPITLDRNNFLIELPFNKVLKVMKYLENVRLLFN